jgi:predicted O-methyltransferase YrrM
MTMAERIVLYGLVVGLRPRRCLEIGTFKGGSALIIVAALDDSREGILACVDPNAEIKAEHWKEIAHRAILFQAPSPEILQDASRAVGGQFDFALIDGDHSAQGVVRDIAGVLPLLESPAYLLFHDAYNQEVIKGIRAVLAQPENCLTDCGLISTEKTVDASSAVAWGGLQLLRFFARK